MGFVWLASAGFFYFLAARHGTQIGQPNDGCLYGICNIILAFLGGGIGFLVLIHHYPYFIISSCLGSILAPGFGTLYIISRAKKP